MTTLVPAVSLFDRLGSRTSLLRLLPHFYADVRQHREIAPVFTARITEWPAHLEKIAAFWSVPPAAPRSTEARCLPSIFPSASRSAISKRGLVFGRAIAMPSSLPQKPKT